MRLEGWPYRAGNLASLLASEACSSLSQTTVTPYATCLCTLYFQRSCPSVPSVIKLELWQTGYGVIVRQAIWARAALPHLGWQTAGVLGSEKESSEVGKGSIWG